MIKSSRQLKDLIRNLSKEKSADVENDDTMNKLWKSYQKKFSYAEDITWGEVMQSVREIYKMME